MKTKVFIFTTMISLGIIFQGCEKENETPMKSNNTATTSSNTKQFNNYNKSTDSTSLRLEYLSKAANVEDISYANNIYTVSFYDATPDHTVSVNSFSLDLDEDFDAAFVEIEVYSPSSATITIDSEQDLVSIEGLGTFSFSQINDSTISTTSNSLLKIASVITAHHALIPEQSTSYDDNGTSDEYPDIDDVGIGFWKTKSVAFGPCVDDLQTYIVSYERLWLFKGTRTIDLPC